MVVLRQANKLQLLIEQLLFLQCVLHAWQSTETSPYYSLISRSQWGLYRVYKPTENCVQICDSIALIIKSLIAFGEPTAMKC